MAGKDMAASNSTRDSTASSPPNIILPQPGIHGLVPLDVDRLLPHPITVRPKDSNPSGLGDLPWLVRRHHLRLVRRGNVLPHALQEHAGIHVAAHDTGAC